MGEKQTKPFQLGFNGFLKVAFQGSRVTSDGGLILVRELDEHLGMSQLIAQHLTDPRGTNTRLPLEDGRPVGEACPVLLAAVSRRVSDAAGVRGDSAANLGVAVACGMT